MANSWGNSGNSGWLYFSGHQNHFQWWLQREIKRHLLLGRKVMTNLDRILKSRDITLSTKVHLVKAMVFPVVMYGCESWTIKKAEYRRTDAFEPWYWRRLLRVPWTKVTDHPKGDQAWVFIGRTDVEAEAAIFWPPNVKSWLIWKDPDVGKNWRQEEKGTTEDETVRWHHRYEFECTRGVGDEQGGLACCGSWDHKEWDMTEQLNWNKLIRGQQIENHNHRKLTNLITWTTTLSNSMKLKAMLCRATQDGRVMVESSDKIWPTGEGNGKPLQYSCPENPMNSMKRQKDRTLKDELRRSVGAQYAAGDQWRNNSRKN